MTAAEEELLDMLVRDLLHAALDHGKVTKAGRKHLDDYFKRRIRPYFDADRPLRAK